MKPVKDITPKWLIRMLMLERRRAEQLEKENQELRKLERKLQ